MFSWWQGGEMCPPMEHFLASSYHEDAKKCSIIFLLFGACHIKKNSFCDSSPQYLVTLWKTIQGRSLDTACRMQIPKVDMDQNRLWMVDFITTLLIS
jgi:hypothetical protein